METSLAQQTEEVICCREHTQLLAGSSPATHYRHNIGGNTLYLQPPKAMLTSLSAHERGIHWSASCCKTHPLHTVARSHNQWSVVSGPRTRTRQPPKSTTNKSVIYKTHRRVRTQSTHNPLTPRCSVFGVACEWSTRPRAHATSKFDFGYSNVCALLCSSRPLNRQQYIFARNLGVYRCVCVCVVHTAARRPQRNHHGQRAQRPGVLLCRRPRPAR